MPDLDLSDAAVATLAARVEEQQRAFGAIRYGSVFRVGAARVVLNPDAPFATANFAGTMTGSPAVAEATLARLPEVWAEAELAPVILLDSPSCLPELSVVAEESGYEAVEESAVMLLADRTALLDGEPGILTRPVSDRDDPAVIATVLGDAFGYAAGVERSLAEVLGHRLDDPRVEAVVAEDGGEVAGAAFAFVQGDLAYVTDTGVRQESRGHRLGRALGSAVAARCLTRGARVVWLAAEAGGAVERFWSWLGFATAYTAVTYQWRE
ncbi:MAG TPA: GNAT family N-acetyltransferase [Frankiaceae bacterium]|nr:GNAT family N-acetyltransferase [Frankiaceae bacterium]